MNNFTKNNEQYKIFAEEKSKCQSCSLFDFGKKVVQSEGCINNPTFVIIGESPGQSETEQDRPFIGKAGQRLRSEIRKHPVFTKENTLLTNIICCRPVKNVFPKYYDVFQVEEKGEMVRKGGYSTVLYCMNKWLMRELKILKPKVLITLGSQPLKYIRDEDKITQIHGTWKFIDKLQVWSFATFHPSYVLRCANDSSKKDIPKMFEEDIATVARCWRDIVENDDRLKLTPKEWIKHRNNSILEKIKGI